MPPYTDEQLRDKSCGSKGCINFAKRGYLYCDPCMGENVYRLDDEDAIRKLMLFDGYSRTKAEATLKEWES